MIVLYLLARIIISVIHSYLFWFSMSFFYFTLFFNFIWERKIYAKKIFYMFAKISRSFLISLFILFCLFFLLLVFLFIKFLELRFLAFFSFFVNLFKLYFLFLHVYSSQNLLIQIFLLVFLVCFCFVCFFFTLIWLCFNFSSSNVALMWLWLCFRFFFC